MLAKSNKDGTVPQNYRHISLLPAMSKTAERVVLMTTGRPTNDLSIHLDAQYRFRHEQWTKHFDRRNSQHQILTGIWRPRSVPRRSQGVRRSPPQDEDLRYPVTITQMVRSFLLGAVLSPLLLNIYTADMPVSEDRHVRLTQFADDSVIGSYFFRIASLILLSTRTRAKLHWWKADEEHHFHQMK